MARKLTSREILFVGGLGLLAIGWMWHSWTAPPVQPEGVAKKADDKGSVALAESPVVHLDMLERSLVKYDATGRDLFRYQPRPPSWAEVKRLKHEADLARIAQAEAEKRAAAEAKKRAEEDAARQVEAALHPAPPPPPTPPAVTFQFIGYVGPANDRVAAFLQNNDTLVAKTGEVIARDFKVQEIRYASVVLAFTDPRFQGQSRELPLFLGK